MFAKQTVQIHKFSVQIHNFIVQILNLTYKKAQIFHGSSLKHNKNSYFCTHVTGNHHNAADDGMCHPIGSSESQSVEKMGQTEV